MNDIQVFKNEQFGTVRTMMIDDQPWFVGKDVAEILGYANPQKAIRDHVDDDDKTVNESFTVNGTMAVLINESGLYSLTLSSKLPTAKAFKRWITSEVLPSIRKHGAYLTDAKAAEILLTPEAGIRMLQEIIAERAKSAKLSETVALNEARIQEIQPKADYYDIILQSASTVSVTQIAKDYGMSAKHLNQLLHDLGIQFKQGEIWLLYQEYADKGYTQSKTFSFGENGSKQHSYWTQKGRVFLYEFLKKHGVLPMIECGNESEDNGESA